MLQIHGIGILNCIEKNDIPLTQKGAMLVRAKRVEE